MSALVGSHAKIPVLQHRSCGRRVTWPVAFATARQKASQSPWCPQKAAWPR